MCNTDQPTLGLEFQERLDSWACCSVAPGEWEEAKVLRLPHLRSSGNNAKSRHGILSEPEMTHRFF